MHSIHIDILLCFLVLVVVIIYEFQYTTDSNVQRLDEPMKIVSLKNESP